MMLHSQARVIVLIILPEMQLIKKENTLFPEVPAHSLGGISTEFTGNNQAKELLTNLWCLTHPQSSQKASHFMYLFFQDYF